MTYIILGGKDFIIMFMKQIPFEAFCELKPNTDIKPQIELFQPRYQRI